MKFIKVCAVAVFLISCTSDISFDTSAREEMKDSRTAAQWYQQGRESVQKRKAAVTKNSNSINTTKAKNIIFVLGDGMGVSTLTAARIYVGQQQGLLGEEFALSFEEFPYSALIKTYNVDLQTPDSAGTMSALMTGVKTNEGIISLPDSVQRGDCASISQEILPTFIDLAKAKGKSTAMITTARVTHATPATTYAHSVDRNWESDEAIPNAEKERGCTDIASQFVDNKQHSLDILFGGGRRHFLPKEDGGKRSDNRNLIEEWQQRGRYVSDLEALKGLEALEKSPTLDESVSNQIQPWLGLFSHSHMDYAYQRPPQQPSLQQMTEVALTRLQKNKQGYALVIEAGRIDHGHHDGTAYKALTETQELHETVAWLLTQVDTKETLIIVTADHSHTLTLAGYATRGNPILGDVVSNDAKGYPKRKASLDLTGQPYTSLGYRDGPGAIHGSGEDHLSENTLAKDDPNYRQAALVPMDYETHGGEDVALYAIGPQSQLFSGTLEQHWVFHALKYAM
ncbi:probable alkaline phosphatase family protein [Oleispira antarctica RB-8]|uniref:Probable alkaline phosphatase family protein n=1 Tax=Oleispira antarctica RB-8 TaxID=698738 RepID=R4YKW5_OLEAN|nr:probable alkaline phosphatase family protein [Oleispira antarctica RB-8]